MALQSYNPDGSMQGLAATNADSATPFTTAGRVEQVGTCCGAVIADHFFEGNVPLLTVRTAFCDLVVERWSLNHGSCFEWHCCGCWCRGDAAAVRRQARKRALGRI